MTEIYELSEDGNQLFVTTKLEGDGRRPTISFRRVYDSGPLLEIEENGELAEPADEASEPR